MRSLVFASAAFSVLLVTACSKSDQAPDATSSAPPANAAVAPSTTASAASSAAPAWSLKDLDGKTVQLSDFKGKVVVLDFWATWCPPCRAEIPNFVDLQKQYGDKGLQIVGISLDQGGVPVVSDFAKAQSIDYPIVIGDETVAHAYGDIQGIPTTFIIDPQGNIAQKHVGYTEKTVFEDEIKQLLPKQQ